MHGLDKKDRERILEPFKGGVNANDAQSYITLEEWIRRIIAAGELDKYAGLIVTGRTSPLFTTQMITMNMEKAEFG